jgi:hypothetical protein
MLPPLEIDEQAVTLTTTLAVARGRPRTIRVSPQGRGMRASTSWGEHLVGGQQKL